METGEIIVWIVGIIIVLMILESVMPYVVMFLALCGIYYLFEQCRHRN
jgi:hypothetical protein